MRVNLVTYRWGEEFVGGAELHHRRLAMELRDAGHQVTVLTTDGAAIRPFCHWGVEWERRPDAPRETVEDGITVRRHAMRRLPRSVMAVLAKVLQYWMESEEAFLTGRLQEALLGVIPAHEGALHLLHGFHYPEVHGGAVHRWTQGTAHFAAFVPPAWKEARFAVAGRLPHAATLSVERRGTVIARKEFPAGEFTLEVDLPVAFAGTLKLETSSVWRPLRDFRALGAYLYSACLASSTGEKIWADTREDHRSLGRQVPARWQEWLRQRAMARPSLLNLAFDALRGPLSPGLAWSVVRSRADVTLHANMPWGNFRLARSGDAVMPLWHVEDEFYAWNHYADACRRARLVLANNEHTNRFFYPFLPANSAFVGPPIWSEYKCTHEAVARFREDHGIGAEDVLVLTVCRKSGEKRYDALVTAVAKLRATGLPVRFLGVGPDADGKPVDADGCRWIGALGGQDLVHAYEACDIFGLMSESESFGMVVPEAWHHARPVVVNRTCGPLAALVEDGVDGLAVLPGRELEEALRQLVLRPEDRQRMGEAGLAKAQRQFVRGAAAKRFLDAWAG